MSAKDWRDSQDNVDFLDIDWAVAPSGATHFLIKDSGVAWFKFKDDLSFPNTWKDGEWKNVRLPTRKLTPKPAPKRLTQAVFDGLPPEYLWAAVDGDGETYAHAVKPECHFYSGRWVQPIIRGSLALFGGDHDATDWQNSLIERQDVPTADKPESITDIARSIEAARVAEKSMPFPDGDERYFETSDPYAALPKTNALADAVGKFHATASESTKEMIKKMIAGKLAACIEDEQAERTYPHYFKDVSAVDAIDLYHVARLYQITDPALFHAFKKIACAGKRGAKDQAQDVQEAIDALQRWQELSV